MHKVHRRWVQGDKAVRGPASAVFRCLEQLQWTFISPFVFRDQEGKDMHLVDGSPAVLRKRLYDALQCQHLAEFGWKIAKRGEESDEELAAMIQGRMDFELLRRT
eukprot:1000997-Karenia_brevis.AAC.1